MKILYTGWYGYHNAGDDAFVYITDWQLRKKFPNSEIYCLSPQHYGYGVQSIFLSKKMSFKAYLLSLIWYIPRMDVLVFSGGSLFKGSFNSNYHYAIIKTLCKLFRVKMLAIGVSVGPFLSKEESNKWTRFLTCFSLLALRDKRSYKLAREMGLNNDSLGFDIACMLPNLLKECHIDVSGSNKDTIGVSLCSFATESFQSDIKKSLLGFFKQKKRCDKIKMLVLKGGENGDKKISEDLATELCMFGYQCEVIDYHDPFCVIQNMKSCKMMICTRLHAGIFAYSFGVPFLMFEYEEKCTDFLNEIGKTDKCRIPELTFDKLGDAFENILSEKEILKPIDEMNGVVEQTFMLLKGSVDGC